jgi:hypothetical protein
MKVYKITLLVVDHDALGAAEIKSVIEDTNYPNDCIAPSVVGMDTREVTWSDGHPLNSHETKRAEFQRLFGP